MVDSDRLVVVWRVLRCHVSVASPPHPPRPASRHSSQTLNTSCSRAKQNLKTLLLFFLQFSWLSEFHMQTRNPSCHRSGRKAGSAQRGRRGWSAGRRSARVGGAAVCRHSTVDQLGCSKFWILSAMFSWLASFSSSTDTSWPLVMRRDKTKRRSCWNMTSLHWLEFNGQPQWCIKCFIAFPPVLL